VTPGFPNDAHSVAREAAAFKRRTGHAPPSDARAVAEGRLTDDGRELCDDARPTNLIEGVAHDEI